MDSTINNKTLRESAGFELFKYFRRLLSRLDKTTVTTHLLASISAESIPPRVASIWIHGFADNSCLMAALRFENAISVRRAAIIRFGKRFRGEGFEQLWNEFGGTAGLVELLTHLSVNDVNLVCRALGRSSTSIKGKSERQRCMADLVRALASDHFPDTPVHNPEKRPLMKNYSSIVPACTTEIVRKWTTDENLPKPDSYRLYEAHTELFRSDCIEHLKAHKAHTGLHTYKPLLHKLPTTPAGGQLSESMQFSLTILRTIEGDPLVRAEPKDVLHLLACPLLRRLAGRKSTVAIQAQVIDSATRCLQQRPATDPHRPLDCSDLLRLAVRLWTRDTKRYSTILAAAARLVPGASSFPLQKVTALLYDVRTNLRYKLLRELLQYLQHFGIDLDEDAQIQKLGARWPASIFLVLLPEDARKFLGRLEHLLPAGFIDWSCLPKTDYVLGHSVFKFDHRNDTTILRVYLWRGQPINLYIARQVINDRQKLATDSREQADRAYWAKSAIFCAISSGSLDLYKETLLWTRRFNRDAMTVKELYAPGTLQTEEGLSLLSGIPGRSGFRGATITRIKQDLVIGNLVVLLLLETATMALREPSFYLPDWDAVLTLPKYISEVRARRSSRLQGALRLTDQETFETVWEDMCEMLLDAEKVGLQDVNERLQFCNPKGPLLHDTPASDGVFGLWGDLGGVFSRDKRGLLSQDHPTTALCRFIDEHAKRRNSLWETLRKSGRPALVALPPPWTRGLPIQELMPILGKMYGYAEAMPFMLSRAESVVFLDPQYALADPPTDTETLDAIGSFVDDYAEAVRFYCNAPLTEVDRQLSVQRAWDHCIDQLSAGRMDRLQAIHFWRAIFQRADVIIPVKDTELFERPDPSLPESDDFEAMEWNPDPNPERWIKRSRKLVPACLDVLLNPILYPIDTTDHTWSESLARVKGSKLQRAHLSKLLTAAESNCHRVEPATVKIVHEPCWHNVKHAKFLHPRTREALIAAALLYINSRNGGSRILTTPFPSAQDCRYPALFLDEDFLEREDVRSDFGRPVLSRLRQDLPGSLIGFQCRTMLDALQTDQKRPVDLEKETFFLLKFLVKGENPQMALEFVQHVITQRPADSSWHRYLFTRGMLNSLPPKRVAEFVAQLFAGIGNTLSKQAKQVQPPGEAATNASVPFVKISTVKMLAQTLSGADFIDENMTADLLIELFDHSQHLDIRVAIVESLVTILSRSRDTHTKKSVILALERLAVPVAAALNERHPLSTEDWEKARSCSEPPEVYQPDSRATGPMLTALVNACANIGSEDAEAMISHILLPIVETSAANNSQWTELFLESHRFTLNMACLPHVPVKPHLLTRLVFGHTASVPASTLQMLAQLITVNLQPPAEVGQITKAVLESSKLRASGAGKHWLSLWHNEGRRALMLGVTPIHSLLLKDFSSTISGGITHELVRDLVMRQAEMLIMRCDGTFGEQEYLFLQLSPPFRQRELSWQLWLQNSRPLVETIIAHIEALRTPQWQANPERKPVSLPDTYGMRLWLLTYAGTPWLPGHSTRLGTFAEELYGEIETLAGGIQLYHEKWRHLKAAALMAWPIDYCFLAWRLGSLEHMSKPGPGLAEFLRIELADELLQAAEVPKDASHAVKARHMLADWASSEIEEIRTRGMRTARVVSKENNGKKAWFSVGVELK